MASPSRTPKLDLSISGALIALSLFVIWGTRDIPPPFFDPIGSAAFPKYSAYIILALAVAIGARALLSLRKAIQRPKKTYREEPLLDAPRFGSWAAARNRSSQWLGRKAGPPTSRPHSSQPTSRRGSLERECAGVDALAAPSSRRACASGRGGLDPLIVPDQVSSLKPNMNSLKQRVTVCVARPENRRSEHDTGLTDPTPQY